MTVAELIEKLKEKNQSEQVEFVVVKTNGEIVVADVKSQAKPMIKVLKLFASS